MKKHLNILCTTVLAIMLVATSCNKESNEPETEDNAVEYDVVPYSITVGITPMTDKIDGVELKTTFADGDFIEISNYKILVERAILTSNDCAGKDKATFSGELKVKRGKSLISGTTTLTASLKNSNAELHLYNDGIPFIDAQEIESYEEGLNKYSYWACENYTYETESINLTQSTVFAEFNLPFSRIDFCMTKGRASCTKTISKHNIFAVAPGTNIMNETICFDVTLDTKDNYFYQLGDDVFEKCCLPKPFDVGGGKLIYFSKGNLQFRPLDGKWRFAPTQYHKCFEPDTEVGDKYELWYGEDKWTDLFGWGSWTLTGNPYSTSEELSDYYYNCENDVPYGYHSLGREWTLLTKDEWEYLLFWRPDAMDKVGVALAADIEGIVLLPDEWTLPEGLMFDVFDVNEYTAEEWQEMESAGAVFFPVTHYRFGQEICMDYFYAVDYWLKHEEAYSAKLGTDLVNYCENQPSYYIGYPVRLIYDPNYIPPADDPIVNVDDDDDDDDDDNYDDDYNYDDDDDYDY